MAPPRRPNPLASSGVDRAAALRRAPEQLAALRTHPDARVLVVRPPHVLLADEGSPVLVDLLVDLGTGEDELYLLGVENGVATFAMDVGDRAAGPEGRWTTLMEVGATLSQRDGSLLSQALGLANWHRRHRFCGCCGAGTEMGEAGYLRTCTGCGTQHFPRLDPAVIMLVTHGERCILGRQASWPARMFSALAGFVEPGESIEDAVAREVAEEVGVAVTSVRYHSSQPWPFPSSLMLGFMAATDDEFLRVDRSELDDAAWFERAELAQLVGDGGVMLPGKVSIARSLVDAWLAGEGSL